jgi:hypothetical protein
LFCHLTGNQLPSGEKSSKWRSGLEKTSTVSFYFALVSILVRALHFFFYADFSSSFAIVCEVHLVLRFPALAARPTTSKNKKKASNRCFSVLFWPSL